MNYKTSFIKDNIFIILGHVLVYARGIILLPILVKNLGVSLYGGYVLLTTGIGFISAISTCGVGFKFKRFMPSAKSVAEMRNLFYPQFIFQLFSAFAVIVILIFSSHFIKSVLFKGEIDFSLYPVALIMIFYVLYGVSADFFRYTNKMKIFTFAITIEAYLMVLFIAVAIFIFHKKTLDYLLLAYLFSLAFVAIPLLVKVFQNIGFALDKLRIRDLAEDISMGFPLLLSYVVDFILSGSDKYVIAILMSTTAVGYYSPAYTLGSLIILVPKACAGVVLPPLLSSAHDAKKEHEVKSLVEYTIKLFLLIAIPFTLGIFILSRRLLELLANIDVAEAAYLVTPIVAVGTLFFGLNLIFSQILFVKLKTKIIFGINVLSAVLNLVLNIIFISIFKNIMVAAITTLLSYFISFIILSWRIRAYIRINYDFNFISKCISASVIMSLFLNYSYSYNRGGNFMHLGLSIIVSVTLYILFLFIFKAFSKREIEFMKDFFITRKYHEAN